MREDYEDALADVVRRIVAPTAPRDSLDYEDYWKGEVDV